MGVMEERFLRCPMIGWCAFLLTCEKSTEREFFVSLSLSIFVLFLSSRHARSLSLAFSLLFSSFFDIYIGAAKERKEITRHPSPSLALSFSLCVRVVPEHKKNKKKRIKNFR